MVSSVYKPVAGKAWRICPRFEWLLLMLALLAGCDKPYRSSLSDQEARKMAARHKPPSGLALSVCAETIDFDRLYNAPLDLAGRRVVLGPYLTFVARGSDLETFRQKVRQQVESAMENLIYDTLLYQQARREGGEKVSEGVEKTAQLLWRQFVLDNGGNAAAAEEVLHKQGLDRKQFLERQKRQILTQYILSLRLKSEQPISHREVIETYNRIKTSQFIEKPRLTFRSIDIEPSRLQLIDPDTGRLEQARQLARQLLDRIEHGEDFGALAHEYSHGPMASSGGLWASVDPCSLAGPYDRLAGIVMDMEIGQVKGPVELEGQIFIVRLEHKQEGGFLPLDQVQDRVQDWILAERRRRAQVQLEAELAERAKVGDVGAFIEGFIAQVYRRSREGL